MYKALYRTCRPEVFDEVLGQEHIVRILKNQIKNEEITHAYLFCGTRGTGKTTVARLLAKGINCLSQGERPCGVCSSCENIKKGGFIDVVEIDAASNNGVDNIRELRESVNYPPAAGRKKVYIIDEVHMLSTGAFNALLKTLEEPPDYVVFILATTEPQKLPATILSRCMRLDFKRIPEKTIIRGMSDICGKMGIRISDDALRIIAANSDGSVRDSLSILDQCVAGMEGHVTEEGVLDFLGASGEETFLTLTELVVSGETGEAIRFLTEKLADGKDVRQFITDWTKHYRNLLIMKFVDDTEGIVNLSRENTDRVAKQAEKIPVSDVRRGIYELSKTFQEARWSTQPGILLELALIKLSSKDHGSEEIPTGKRTVYNTGKERSDSHQKEPVDDGYTGETDHGDRGEDGAAADNEASDICSQSGSAGGDRSENELDKYWEAIFYEGLKIKKSLGMIKTYGKPVAIDDDRFTVEVSHDYVKDYAESNRDILERLTEKHTGKKRRMEIVMKKKESAGGISVEEMKQIAEKTLGIKVETE